MILTVLTLCFLNIGQNELIHQLCLHVHNTRNLYASPVMVYEKPEIIYSSSPLIVYDTPARTCSPIITFNYWWNRIPRHAHYNYYHQWKPHRRISPHRTGNTVIHDTYYHKKRAARKHPRSARKPQRTINRSTRRVINRKYPRGTTRHYVQKDFSRNGRNVSRQVRIERQTPHRSVTRQFQREVTPKEVRISRHIVRKGPRGTITRSTNRVIKRRNR